MFILYMDESGMHKAEYFVLAGIAVHERQTYLLSNRVEQLVSRYLPSTIKEIPEIHATSIRSGKEPWDQLTEAQRRNLLKSLYELIRRDSGNDVVLFGVAVERAWLARKQTEDLSSEDEYGWAFESIVKMFDTFLVSKHKIGETQKGLVVIAASHEQYQKKLELLAKKISSIGTRWGELYNLVEVPLFTAAKNSRLLQLADLCANAIWGRYEKGLTRYFDYIAPKFFTEDNLIKGLRHYSSVHMSCCCPACISVRKMS